MKTNNSLKEVKSHLKNITINIPDVYEEVIQKLIKLKITPSRSEAIRTAIRELLYKDFALSTDLTTFLKD